MNLLFRTTNTLACIALAALLGSATVPRPRMPARVATQVAKDCFSGKWGNDFVLCGGERTGRSGKGNSKKRLDEELTLQFKGKDKGELSFYDCRTIKRADQSIPFTYELANDVIRFYWEGSAREIETYQAAFGFRDTFRYECRKDTLVFTDGFLNSTAYQGSTYFVRR